MTELPPDPEAEDAFTTELVSGYDWLTVACNVIQTLALIVIAVALVAMV